MPRLLPRWREMLVMTVDAGWCISTEPSVYAAVWSVRTGPGGGVDRDFSQGAGDALLRLGLIELVDMHLLGYPVVIRYFEPTAMAIKMVAMWKAEGRYRTMGMLPVVQMKRPTRVLPMNSEPRRLAA